MFANGAAQLRYADSGVQSTRDGGRGSAAMFRMVVLAGVLAVPVAAGAQSAVSGQQNNQPSATQNQSQQQTDNSQQPPQAHTLPPTPSAQTQPNPLPQLAK